MDNKNIVKQIKKRFNLKPLPQEGGFYRETYRSNIELPEDILPISYKKTRIISTAIFYLLTPETHSVMHKLPGDEVYHFYLGDPVELLQLHPDGSADISILGQKIFKGMKVQQVVPGGTWQGARLQGGGTYALLGTTMAPGFEFKDFERGDTKDLSENYPTHSDIIKELH